MTMTGGKDLRDHLNELWKTTVDQFDEIKDVIIRNSHVGRKKLDTAFLRRQRDRLFAELGESVYGQVEAGELDLAPAGQRLIERLREVRVQIEAEEQEIARMAEQAGETMAPAGDEAEAGFAGDDVVTDPEAEDEAVEEQPEAGSEAVEAAAEPAADEDDSEEADEAQKDVDAAAFSSDKDDPAPAKPKRRRRRRPAKKKSEEAGDDE